VATRGQRLATAAIGPRRREVVAVPSEDVYAVVRRGAQSSQRVIWRPGLRLPVEAGSRVAEVRVFEGSTLVARAPLVAARSVAP
ncbi:MAG: hypothetical protein QN178_14335, partial [Armatimonadota bacterium]|nr:hypothetical protein [Armatimonadota bacterium]